MPDTVQNSKDKFWLSDSEINLVRSSFSKLSAHEDELVTLFYVKLFDAAPELRGLFADNLEVQKKHFAGALNFVVSNLDKREVVTESLTHLGRRHAGYHVIRLHFFVGRVSLMEALMDTVVEGLTKEELAAWSKFLDLLSEIMTSRIDEPS